MKDLRGKVAIVTGSSSGVGAATVKQLAALGCHSVINYNSNLNGAEAVAAECQQAGAETLVMRANVANDEDCRAMAHAAIEKWRRIDILVNNAGGSRSREDITGTDLEDFRGTFDLNLFGGYELMKLVIPHMKRSSWGRIINIASIWGREYGGNISYMSAKAALIAATKHSAVSLAKHGILVNSIAPGSIAHKDGSWERFQSENSREVVDGFIEDNLPMGKFGWPEPLGDLVAFLSSDRAGMITGSCIVIDGGQSISMI